MGTFLLFLITCCSIDKLFRFGPKYFRKREKTTQNNFEMKLKYLNRIHITNIYNYISIENTIDC